MTAVPHIPRQSKPAQAGLAPTHYLFSRSLRPLPRLDAGLRPAQARLLRTSVGGSSAAAEARFGVRGADECHALAAQREGAQRIKQGSGGNGRSVGSGQWVGSGPRGHRADGDGCRGRPLSAVCRAMRWPFGARGRRGSSKAAGATAEACAAASGWAAGRGRGTAESTVLSPHLKSGRC